MPDNPENIAPTPDTLQAFTSALAVRVNDQGEAIRGIRAEMHEMRTSMATGASVNALSSKIDSLIAAKAPQWSTCIAAISLLITLVVRYTSLTAWPINANLNEMKSDAKEYRKAAASELKELRNMIVPRGEHEQRWANQATQTANLQRQIDDMAKAYGSTYSLRDAIGDMGKRLHRLEHGPVTGGGGKP